MSQEVLESVHEHILDQFPDITTKMVEFGIAYLKRFNYINGDTLTEQVVETAAKDFQESFGIESDGVIGPQTLKAMTYPRCGCVDREHLVEGVTDSVKWGFKNLKWCVVDYLPSMSKEDYLKIIKAVLDHLSTIIDVTFEQTTDPNKANFLFRVSTSRRDELGVESGVLAFCEIPPSFNFKGTIDLTMDGAEKWLRLGETGRGIRTKNVFYHEFLHGMGLRHSDIKTALMAAFYSAEVDEPVSPDDRERLIRLYGSAKVAPIPTPVPVPTPTPSPIEPELILKIKGNVTSLEAVGWRMTKVS